MKLSSLFKFKTKQNNLNSNLKDLLDKVQSNLFSELNKKEYFWSKTANVKKYECFIFSKFLISYSFSITYSDLDKKIVNLFSKEFEEVFLDLHEQKYSEALVYKDMKGIIDQKNDLTNDHLLKTQIHVFLQTNPGLE